MALAPCDLALRLLWATATGLHLNATVWRIQPAKSAHFEQNGSDPVRSPGPSPLDGPGGYFCATPTNQVEAMSHRSPESRSSIRPLQAPNRQPFDGWSNQKRKVPTSTISCRKSMGDCVLRHVFP